MAGATFGLWCGELPLEKPVPTRYGQSAGLKGVGEVAALRGLEKLCLSVLLDAIHAYVEGEAESAWWLFEEGVTDLSRRTQGLSLAEVCRVLDRDVETVRAKLKAVLKVRGLSKGQTRAYIIQQAGWKGVNDGD